LSSWKKKRSIMRRYNLTAEMYDTRYCIEQQAKYEVSLKSVKLNSGSIVLDLGCGSGLFFSQVASFVSFVVGIDVSKQLLLQARERAKPYSNAGVILADADHLPFSDSTFTHVFAFTMLQNMPKPLHTLQQAKNAAQGNAFFVLTGLKRAVSIETFSELLEKANLRAMALTDEETLQCYVVTAVNLKK
jgi:ubiquinone/menaquinone biosynthesis C-methylase UbiE